MEEKKITRYKARFRDSWWFTFHTRMTIDEIMTAIHTCKPIDTTEDGPLYINEHNVMAVWEIKEGSR